MASAGAARDAGGGMIEALRRRAATALLVVRIDSRRPASWLALLAAAIAVGGAGGTAAAWLPLALLGGGLAGVAAVGDPPRGLAAAGTWPEAAWWCVRSAWPLAGTALAAAMGCDGTSASVVAVAVAVTAALTFVAVARGLTAADAAAVGLLAAAAATLAGFGRSSPGPAWLPATLAWLVSAAASLWLTAGSDPVDAWRRVAKAGAMTMALAAMAGCFFLAPEYSRWYAVVAGACFVAAALPEAVLGAGSRDGSARGRLWRSVAPASGGVPRPVLAAAGRAARVVAEWAAILAWPAIVAAVLRGGEPAGGDGPLRALLVLAALSCLFVVVAGVVRWFGGTEETAFAACAGLVVLATWQTCVLPALPRPPSLSRAVPPPTAVEGFGRSCQTSQVPQGVRSGAVPLACAGHLAVPVQNDGLVAR